MVAHYRIIKLVYWSGSWLKLSHILIVCLIAVARPGRIEREGITIESEHNAITDDESGIIISSHANRGCSDLHARRF